MGRLHDKAAWHRRARRQLQYEPLCAMCLSEGKIVAARIVDHVEPHHNDRCGDVGSVGFTRTTSICGGLAVVAWVGCVVDCPAATSGHATAAAPSSVMNSRRVIRLPRRHTNIGPIVHQFCALSRASIIFFASATIASLGLFSSVAGLSGSADDEPGGKIIALQPFPTGLTSRRYPL